VFEEIMNIELDRGEESALKQRGGTTYIFYFTSQPSGFPPDICFRDGWTPGGSTHKGIVYTTATSKT